MISWQQDRWGVSLRIGGARNEESMLGSQRSVVPRHSGESTFAEYFLVLFWLSFSNLTNLLDHGKDQVEVLECYFQP